jgi:hypothetical protein
MERSGIFLASVSSASSHGYFISDQAETLDASFWVLSFKVLLSVSLKHRK